MRNFYDTDRAVAEYLLFHYAPPEVQMPWAMGPMDATEFPRRCVTETFVLEALPPGPRALDLGCAVGRSTFELSRFCGEVIGIDASERFIDAARRLQQGGSMAYDLTVEGNLRQPDLARVPAGSNPDRVRFEVGDALQLRRDLGTFDLVLAANLIDRVPEPAQLLRSFGALVRPGGQLVITSPYTWLADYTPQEAWLSGDDLRTSERLAEHLHEFDAVGRRDLPFVIREHVRKFQWSVAEATSWRKR